MLNFKGDHNEEIIRFPNGVCVKIDFGYKERDDFGGYMSCSGHKHRRVRLFDSSNNLISETIEENPYYDSRDNLLPDEFFENHDPKILY